MPQTMFEELARNLLRPGDNMNTWMVYFKNGGCREGNERIIAPTRDEAIRLYRLFFNVTNDVKCIAIPIIDGRGSFQK